MSTPETLKLRLHPVDALATWPGSMPLAALVSGAAGGRCRWSALLVPGRALVTGTPPQAKGGGLVPDPLPSRASSPHSEMPLGTGWIGYLGYDLGSSIEPRAAHSSRPTPDRLWPTAVWRRCDTALVFDHVQGTWHGFGDDANGLANELRARERSRPGPFSLGALASQAGDARYQEMVRKTIEYIRAGDIYQANITHRLSATFSGSARGLFDRLIRIASPWYGAYLEFDEGAHRFAIASASPELFLFFDPRTRRVETRPMKGTRRAGPGAREELENSAKDRAELNMIIDLMRNDLGRVCEVGSVRVDEARAIELHATSSGGSSRQAGVACIYKKRAERDPHSHRGGLPQPAILQGTATISGILRGDRTLDDLLRATFPGGSITGAPKIRAMQIIDELEPVRRGPYCGAIGFVADSGHAMFNIAIRTALISGEPARNGAPDAFEAATLDYGVGAGIVADSDPESEWRETLDKAGVIHRIAATRAGPT